MSRVVAFLVALFLVPVLGFAQVPSPPPLPDGATISVIQSVQGGIGTVTIQTAPGGVLPPQGPARDQAALKTGTSRIRGHVLAADSGLALRRALVRINSGEIREMRSTVTDTDGRYEFANLPAGRYSVTAGKTSYIDMSYGQRRPSDLSKPIDVGEKQVVDKIDFSLMRGGVITGRVLDEFGEPVANANVQPMQNRFMNGQRRPMPSGQSSFTPDTGEFRLWGLSPGDYFVSVQPRQGGMIMVNESSDDRSGYAATYYPGTPNLALAQPITLAAGETASGVDIMLTPARTAKVSGTAVDSKGQPIRNGFVNAMQRVNGMMMGGAGGQLKPDGTFTISGLAPGDYLLRANSGQPRPGNEAPETLTASVTVNGSDVTGVLLTPVVPAVVTGRVVFDPPSATPDPTTVRVMANPKNPEMMMGMMMNVGPPIVKDDFTFEVKTAPGQMTIRAFVGGPGAAPATQGPWLLKSVRYDSKDVTDSGLDLTSGRDVSGVEIVMTNRPQIVTGQITSARGEIVKDGAVLLFAQDREQWGVLGGRYAAMGRPDKDGKYTVRTLPPGDYFAIAVEQIDNQRYPGDPDYFDLLSRAAVRFSLVEGDARTVDLTLIVQQ